jgi:Domain of unknown function (DUF4331)
MRRVPLRSYVVLGALTLIAVAVLSLHTPARGADAYDSAATRADPAADISDTYLFPSPTNPNNVVVVMDVNPGIASGQGLTTFFNQHVLYQMKFDNLVGSEAQGVAPTEDLVIQFSAGAAGSGSQQIFVYGPAAPSRIGSNTAVISQTGTGFINHPFQTTNGMSVFAGARSDPFFFDSAQFYKLFPDRNDSSAQSCLPTAFGGNASCPLGFNNPGTNGQAGTNVLSLVIEMPKGLLMPNGLGKIAYWATTSTATGQ